MTASNTYGRQTVLPLTNKSGGGVIAGDVVIGDTSNNDAFTTTTSAAFTGIVGIAQETIASNASGRVLVGGYAALVNVNASVTRGHYGATHTVAKQAADAGASRTAGTFVQFLTGGTTPDGLVFNPDLGTGGSTIITKDEGSTLSSSVTTLDFVGGGVTASGAGATTTVTVPSDGILASHVYNPGTAANFDSSSTTLAIVDGTNMVVTFTAPTSGNVQILLEATMNPDTGNGAGNGGNWGLIEGASTIIAGPYFIRRCYGSGTAELGRETLTISLSGLSGSKTYQWAYCTTGSGTTRIRVGGTANSDLGGPATMTVLAAP
jgi:hypothetical protein